MSFNSIVHSDGFDMYETVEDGWNSVISYEIGNECTLVIASYQFDMILKLSPNSIDRQWLFFTQIHVRIKKRKRKN